MTATDLDIVILECVFTLIPAYHCCIFNYVDEINFAVREDLVDINIDDGSVILISSMLDAACAVYI